MYTSIKDSRNITCQGSGYAKRQTPRPQNVTHSHENASVTLYSHYFDEPKEGLLSVTNRIMIKATNPPLYLILVLLAYTTPHVVSFAASWKGTQQTSLLKMSTAGERCDETRSSPVRVLGVCGGIGSGKSTVCQVLVSEFGCLGHIGEW